VVCGTLIGWLAPELLGPFRHDTPELTTPARLSKTLATATRTLDQELFSTLKKVAPGLRPFNPQERLETFQGVQWRSTRLELQLPASVSPEKVVGALQALSFDADWQVRLKPLWLEPLSPSIHITVRGYPTHLLTLHPALQPAEVPAASPRPRIAILIDDLGVDRSALEALWPLETPFSVAILPFTPYALELAERAYQRQKEILVHLPMEPLPRPDGERLEPPLGQLTLQMSLEEVKQKTRRAVLAVPYARGVNNHQGSAFTRDRTRMSAMLEVLLPEQLFFVDSRTIGDSIGLELARELGIPATGRQLFLDNDPEPDRIRQALERLKAVALKKGSALGIGHPYPTTLEVLRTWLPEAQQAGFDLVPVSSVTE